MEDSGNPGMPPDECDWALGDYTTQLDAISRYETVLFTDMLFTRSAVLLV